MIVDPLRKDAELAARARDYRYNLAAKISRQRESGVQTASNWRTDGNHDWFLDRRLFRYLRGSLEHDRFKDIGLRASHRLDTWDVELFHGHDGFLPLSGDSGVTLRSRTGLRAPLAGGLNASLQLNLDREEDPAPDRKATDSTLLVGLGYEW